MLFTKKRALSIAPTRRHRGSSLRLPSFIVGLGFLLSAGVAKTNDPALLLSQATETYRQADLVESSVEKSILSPWKAKEDLSTGKVYYAHGKIRWETDTPEKLWLIVNGRMLYNVQFASPDFPGKNTVSISKVDLKKNADQRFLIDLLESKKPAEKFKITSEPAAGNDVVLNLVPKTPSKIKDVKVTVDRKKKFIAELSYKDDADNMTKIKLGQPTLLDKKKAEGLFEYKPDPKTDQVSNL